jgi:hypothetical protein
VSLDRDNLLDTLEEELEMYDILVKDARHQKGLVDKGIARWSIWGLQEGCERIRAVHICWRGSDRNSSSTWSGVGKYVVPLEFDSYTLQASLIIYVSFFVSF